MSEKSKAKTGENSVRKGNLRKASLKVAIGGPKSSVHIYDAICI